MDDLAGLDWSSSSAQSKPANAPAPTNANYYPSLKPTPPTSGRSTPNPQAKSGSAGPSKSGTPANDSFANLVPFGGQQPVKHVSLQEQQRALQEQRAKSLGFQNAQWTGGSAGAGVSSGGSTPARAISPALPTGAGSKSTGLGSSTNGLKTSLLKDSSAAKKTSLANNSAAQESEDDLLAAFNSSAPVDRSSHFPPPQQRPKSTDPTQGTGDAYAALDDDDPFGLGTGTQKQTVPPDEPRDGDDDVLGLLGKPVSELPRRPKSPDQKPTKNADPRDKAVAELVDMGFTIEKATMALDTTESGTDVQAAVGWLLTQAHSESAGKSSRGPRNSPGMRDSDIEPTWARERRSSPANAHDLDPDAAKSASDLRSNFFKTANSLWKTGQKHFNKAMADLNSDADPSQPRWMRETRETTHEETTPQRAKRPDAERSRSSQQKPADLVDMTDEAMMLESGGGKPRAKGQSQASKSTTAPRSNTQSPIPQSYPPSQPTRPSRRFVEEESAQAYVSPARRKKPTPKPVEEEPDLLFGGSSAQNPPSKPKSTPEQVSPVSRPRPRASTPPRPKAQPRNIPHLSAIALQSSTAQRMKGNEAFKLGNYGDAAAAYGQSLRDIPNKHPLAILLLTNRSLAHLKTGDPKAAIADAESAIEIIGPSRGQNESIDIGGDEGMKPMGPFWGKAMMRRAEGLEQLERWADAAKAWGDCVQGGVGGSQSIQARNRCESALAPKPKAAPPRPAKKATPKPKARSAMDDLNGRPAAASASSSEAVTRLRATNAAAEKAEDERFALSDSVEARLTTWRKGKESNLRALLGSLDTVLWEGANWKKVGMSELIVPSKVKIAYMKGIAKVHPDKLSPGASTEQVMISGAVFSTLNEAWDRFKTENGL